MKKILTLLLFIVLALFIGLSHNFKFAYATENLIPNSSVEVVSSVNSSLPSDWNTDKTRSAKATFGYPVAGYQSSSALKIELSKNSGEAWWYFSDIPVTPGSEYEFSNYYFSDAPSKLTARLLLSDQSYLYINLANLSSASSWTKNSFKFVVPQNAVSVTVYQSIVRRGTLVTDDYQLVSITPQVTNTPTPTLVATPSPTPIPSLTLTPTPTPIVTVTPTLGPTPTPSPTPVPSNNLIQNPSLEDGNTNPTGWFAGKWGTNQTVFRYPVLGYESTKAAEIEMTSYSSGDAKWYFEDVNVSPSVTYTFSDTYKSSTNTALVARYALNGGGFLYSDLGQVNVSPEWTTISRNLTVPEGARSLTIFHLLASVGTLSVDNYSLTEASATSSFAQGFVSFAFDDGWLSSYTNATPVLDLVGIKGTYYIATSLLGNLGYMTSSQVVNLFTSGHEIGSHTRTHPFLTLLSQSQMTDEILGSRQDLELMGVGQVTSFAYPYGDYNFLTDSIVRQSGYASARTSDVGFNNKTDNPYFLKMQSVESGVSVSEISSWIDAAVNDHKWLILLLHRVDDTGGQYNISTSDFEAVVNYINSNNVIVRTVSEGVSLMGS